MTQVQSQQSLETDLARDLERNLKTSRPAQWVSASVRVGPMDLTSVLSSGGDSATVWLSPRAQVATLGVAEVLTGHGPERFVELRNKASVLLSALRADGVRAQLFGGAAFLPEGANEGPWASFGDARLVLPRWILRTAGNATVVTLISRSGEPLGDLSAELRRLLRPRPSQKPVGGAVSEELDEATWSDSVRKAQRGIEAGSIQKTVLARRSVVRFEGEVDSAGVLRGLSRKYPECTCFGFRAGTSVFVGASPEPLLTREGDRIVTEALAGSAAAGEPIDELLSSVKDRHEHRLVVDAIVERLEPLSERVRVSDICAKQLANVTHLRTPIQAELAEGVDTLDLVAALHPTPAVGTVPREAAVRWIRDLEVHPRGWYSGPVGFIDTEGSAEFFVALRSALIESAQVWAYAGAGIVGDSDPAREYEETAWKLKPVLEAAGVQ